MKAKIATGDIDIFLREELKFTLEEPLAGMDRVYVKAGRGIVLTIPPGPLLPEDIVIHLLGKTRYKKLKEFIETKSRK